MDSFSLWFLRLLAEVPPRLLGVKGPIRPGVRGEWRKTADVGVVGLPGVRGPVGGPEVGVEKLGKLDIMVPVR